jgi:hypothetical protein
MVGMRRFKRVILEGGAVGGRLLLPLPGGKDQE